MTTGGMFAFAVDVGRLMVSIKSSNAGAEGGAITCGRAAMGSNIIILLLLLKAAGLESSGSVGGGGKKLASNAGGGGGA